MKRGPKAASDGNPGVKFDARAYALRLIELRPRTVWEIGDKLAKKGVDKAGAAEIIGWLESIGLLDDAKFARDWMENRRHFRPMGVIRLRQELRARGIAQDLINTAVSEYQQGADELPAALDLARRKMRMYRNLDRETAKRRLAGFLARRGYGPSIVAKVLKELLKEMIVE